MRIKTHLARALIRVPTPVPVLVPVSVRIPTMARAPARAPIAVRVLARALPISRLRARAVVLLLPAAPSQRLRVAARQALRTLLLPMQVRGPRLRRVRAAVQIPVTARHRAVARARTLRVVRPRIARPDRTVLPMPVETLAMMPEMPMAVRQTGILLDDNGSLLRCRHAGFGGLHFAAEHGREAGWRQETSTDSKDDGGKGQGDKGINGQGKAMAKAGADKADTEVGRGREVFPRRQTPARSVLWFLQRSRFRALAPWWQASAVRPRRFPLKMALGANVFIL